MRINTKYQYQQILSFLLIFLSLCSLARSQDKLLQVFEMIRHGARGPVEDAYDSNQQTKTAGELTDVGMHQHFQLGSQMRKEYIYNQNLLSPTFNHEEVYFFSTPVNRTLMSAQSHLLGLYPPGTGPKLSMTNNAMIYPPYQNIEHEAVSDGYALPYGIQPFPLYVLGQGEGSISPHNCPNYEKMKAANFKDYSKLISEIDHHNKDLYDAINTMVGTKITSLIDIEPFEDVMTSDIFSGRTLPKDLTVIQINRLWQLRAVFWFISQNDHVSKALQSNTFDYIIDSFQKRAQGSSNLKYILFSGHDSNIARTMVFFNISSADCVWQKIRGEQISALNCEDSPRFAANIIFELWKSSSTNEEYVKLKYNGKYVFLCEKAQTQCGLKEFSQRVQHQLGNYVELCGVESLSVKVVQEQSAVQVLLILFLLSLVGCAILGVLLYKTRKQILSKKPITGAGDMSVNDIGNQSVTARTKQQYIEMEQP